MCCPPKTVDPSQARVAAVYKRPYTCLRYNTSPPNMLSERLLSEVLTSKNTFLLALTLSCLLPGECASVRDELTERNADAMGKASGYLNQHMMDKEEKRSKAMGDAVRFLTDMDRSYLGQVRPRWSDLYHMSSQQTRLTGLENAHSSAFPWWRRLRWSGSKIPDFENPTVWLVDTLVSVCQPSVRVIIHSQDGSDWQRWQQLVCLLGQTNGLVTTWSGI